MSELATTLSPECGAPTAPPACARCGAPCEAVVERVTPTGPRVDAAWKLATRVTVAFLALNLALRGVVAVTTRDPRAQLWAAALVAGAVIAVARALSKRNATALAAWSWMLSAGAGLSLVGGALWWRIASPPAWRVALALVAVALAAVCAAAMFRARRVIDGADDRGA